MGVTFLHCGELLERQGVDPAEQSQAAFGFLQPPLLHLTIERVGLLALGPGDHLFRPVFGHQVVDGQAVLLQGLLRQLLQRGALARTQHLVAMDIECEAIDFPGQLQCRRAGLGVPLLQGRLLALQIAEVLFRGARVGLDQRGPTASHRIEAAKGDQGLLPLDPAPRGRRHRLVGLRGLLLQFGVPGLQGAVTFLCRAGVQARLVMGMPGPLLRGQQVLQSRAIHTRRTGGRQLGEVSARVLQVGDLRLQGGRDLVTLRGDLFEAPRRGRCPLADVHVTLGGRRSARLLLRGLGANIVAVLPGEGGLGLDTGEMIDSALPARLGRHQFLSGLFEGVAQSDDVPRFASLTRGPATQHPAVHSGDQRLRILPDDRGRLLQGLHDVTSAQDRCQGATQKIRSLDVGQDLAVRGLRRAAEHEPNGIVLRQGRESVTGSDVLPQHAGPGMGPEQNGHRLLVPGTHADEAVE